MRAEGHKVALGLDVDRRHPPTLVQADRSWVLDPGAWVLLGVPLTLPKNVGLPDRTTYPIAPAGLALARRDNF
jgi:hypothetical protein